VDVAYERSHRILQPVWDFIREGNEDAMRSPIFPPFLALTFYFSVVSFFTILDLFGKNSKLLQQYKIQKDKEVTFSMVWNAVVVNMWNLLLWILPMTFVQLLWVPPTPLPQVAPTLWQFIWQQVAFIILFDFEYWAWHSTHHKVRFLYRWCHSIHHQYHSPFAFATQYVHPWELLYVGFMITVTPWFFQPHIMTYWCWFLLSNWLSIEVHLGYDFPWAAHNWCFLYGGAPKHDLHHMRPMTNFAPWLNWLDKLMGCNLTHKELEELKVKRRGNLGLMSPEDEEGLKKVN